MVDIFTISIDVMALATQSCVQTIRKRLFSADRYLRSRCNGVERDKEITLHGYIHGKASITSNEVIIFASPLGKIMINYK